MAIQIDMSITLQDLLPKLKLMWKLSAEKLQNLHKSWSCDKGSPVFTVQGRYTSQSWTEWTHGFQFGSYLLQYDATGNTEFLDLGIEGILKYMPLHISHMGVHDHGFNIVSTYGNLLRLIREGRAPNKYAILCEVALRVSGAIQASRWTNTVDGDGYIYSFNGPHSLFIDSIRSLRVLAIAYKLGHVLLGENDQRICLLERLIKHLRTTARYNIYYGERRDIYDVRGRVAHESIFNPINGTYRCPSTQQGYSPFTTWTRGLAWAICGFAEELEFFEVLTDQELETYGGRRSIEELILKAALATADYYIEQACTDGIPIWDTGAPRINKFSNYSTKKSDPYNPYEPVDSSAAAIAAQGLYRLGTYLTKHNKHGTLYQQAALTITNTLLHEPYLSTDPLHQGLLLHSVYHRPRGWDYIPNGQNIPCGESSMWGDYHLRELALLLMREAIGAPYLTFFSCCK